MSNDARADVAELTVGAVGACAPVGTGVGTARRLEACEGAAVTRVGTAPRDVPCANTGAGVGVGTTAALVGPVAGAGAEGAAGTERTGDEGCGATTEPAASKLTAGGADGGEASTRGAAGTRTGCTSSPPTAWTLPVIATEAAMGAVGVVGAVGTVATWVLAAWPIAGPVDAAATTAQKRTGPGGRGAERRDGADGALRRGAAVGVIRTGAAVTAGGLGGGDEARGRGGGAAWRSGEAAAGVRPVATRGEGEAAGMPGDGTGAIETTGRADAGAGVAWCDGGLVGGGRADAGGEAEKT